MPWFPDPNGGPPIQAPTNPNPAGGSLGYYSDPGYNGPPPGGGAGPGTTPGSIGSNSDIGSQITAALGPYFGQTSGFSIQQLEEQKREFDLQLEWARQQFQQLGLPQLEIQRRLADMQIQFQQQQMQMANANLALQQGQLTGMYTPTAPIVSPADFWTQDQATRDLYTQYHGANAAQDWAADQTAAVQAAWRQAGGGQPQQTEQARQFNAGLGLNYLTQAAQFAATDPFQLSDFLRGAQASGQMPQFLQALQNGTNPGGAAGNVGPTPTGATTLPTLSQALQGTGTVNPQTNQALQAIGGIYTQGANALPTGSLESLTPNELQTLQQGITRLYGAQAAPAFLQQYQATRPMQSAGRTAYIGA